VKIFLGGDVMLGRGMDQIFARSCRPAIHESFVSSALRYVELAERAHGPIPRRVEPEYPWGDALRELERAGPDVRIVNLETSITLSEDYELKGINYRVHPANVACLAAAGVDCAVLANNHVLDWGRRGLLETLETLERAGIRTAGAGRDVRAAEAPAVTRVDAARRVLVFAFGFADSGIPEHWAAGHRRPGVHLLPDFSKRSIEAVARQVYPLKRPGDVVVGSIHWGANWGYAIPESHRYFAHELIDRAGVDLVHGHSCHHFRALEIYRGHLIMYGCGDLLNDYEGIGGQERFRADLALMYFADVDSAGGTLRRLETTPLRIRRFRLELPPPEDVEWAERILDRECRRFGSAVSRIGDHALLLS
jgi:poly-gamma-glutamate synthesis protein (capsule biosynthesis protein)